jgi:hypothetical protein
MCQKKLLLIFLKKGFYICWLSDNKAINHQGTVEHKKLIRLSARQTFLLTLYLKFHYRVNNSFLLATSYAKQSQSIFSNTIPLMLIFV